MAKWNQEAEDILRQARREEIKVLVWGPGDPGIGTTEEKKKAYEKRLKIREALRKEFPFAEVFFTEDPEMQGLGFPGITTLELEALQASIADVVVMLDISRGTDLELDYFVPNFTWFRDKVYVFLPERHVPPRGLVKEVFDYIHPKRVKGFTEAEFEECKVATEWAVNGALSAAIKKRLQRN
jgi:hypothetical protein